jgi:insertion element IS1 protein InsB
MYLAEGKGFFYGLHLLNAGYTISHQAFKSFQTYEIPRKNIHALFLLRFHLTLRTCITRVVRKTLGFSKAIQMHDLIMGFFVNRSAFGRLVSRGSLHF